jgi:predicted transcriptional regulator of viral defense system
MKQIEAIEVLRKFDKKQRYVFTKHDLAKLFPHDSAKTLDEGLKRLVKAGLLKRACRGVYVNSHAKSFDSYVIEHIAKALRRDEYNYLSLESMLSEYGIISQIPLDRLTIMTTGRKGTYKTLYGVIEFTHTKRSLINILEHIQTVKERPLRIASKETAVRDLKRVGRNLHLLNIEYYNFNREKRFTQTKN